VTFRDNDNWVFLPIVLAIVAGALVTDVTTTAITVAVLAAFALPGFIIARAFTADAARALVYGLPLGYTLTSLLIIVVVTLRGWDLRWILFFYALGLVLLVLNRRRSSTASEAVGGGHAQADLPLIVGLGLGLTVVALSVPLAHAGSLTGAGYAYTGLFGHDFILRALDAAALGNSIPSDNYFYYGEKTYNYYILWYILPATLYNLLGKHAQITSVISVIDLLNVPIFGALVYYALAGFIASTSTVPQKSHRLGVIFIVLFLLCYSYHWMFFLLGEIDVVATWPQVAHLLTLMGPVSTSWFKDFLFQPHSVLAVMQLMVVMHLAFSPVIRGRNVWIGLLLGSLLLTDTIVCLIGGVTFVIWYALQGKLRARASEFLLIAAVGSAVVALLFGLHIFTVPEYSNKIVIRPYLSVIVALPVLLLLCFGPLPLFSFLAFREKWRTASEQGWFLVILLLVSLFFMLFVTEVFEGNVFLRKGLMTLRLPLIILSASYLYTCALSRWRRIAVAGLALALPTLLTDVYASSNTADARYTTYVSAGEMAAASWLRQNTDEHAVVQSLIEYPGRFDYSLTVIFGERRAALGVGKMAFIRYPNRDAITQRAREIQTLFSTVNSEERNALARGLHIDYIFIGPHERARYPGVEERFAADTVHFKEVYSSATVSVYQVGT
jgi:hypothetical protein